MRRRLAAIGLLVAAAGLLVGCSRLSKLEVQVGELKGNVKVLSERLDAAAKTSQTLDASLKQAAADLEAIKQAQADQNRAQANLAQTIGDLSTSLDEIKARLAKAEANCCGYLLASFSVASTEQTDSLTVRFVDLSQDPGADILHWVWTFGDETTADVQSPTHTYATPGHYVVRLTVTDARGCSASAEQEVAVPPAGASFAPPSVGLTVPVADDRIAAGGVPRGRGAATT